MNKKNIRQQKQCVLEAMEQANMCNRPYVAKVQLNERMATKLCIELLAEGFVVLGEGKYSYTINATAGVNVEEYLKKAKAEI